MLIIYYFIKTNGEKLGSTNKLKIEQMARNKPVFFCDISEFNGNLISSEGLDHPNLLNARGNKAKNSGRFRFSKHG